MTDNVFRLDFDEACPTCGQGQLSMRSRGYSAHYSDERVLTVTSTYWPCGHVVTLATEDGAS